MNIILWSLLIFIAIAAAVSIGTVRLIFTVKGNKLLSISIGFIEAFIGLAIVSKIIRDAASIYTILAYSIGFAAGLYVGMIISEKVSKGLLSSSIISKRLSNEIEAALEEDGFNVTSHYGNGKDGQLKVLNVICKKDKNKKLNLLAVKIDPTVFIVSHTIEGLRGGFIYNWKL